MALKKFRLVYAISTLCPPFLIATIILAFISIVKPSIISNHWLSFTLLLIWCILGIYATYKLNYYFKECLRYSRSKTPNQRFLLESPLKFSVIRFIIYIIDVACAVVSLYIFPIGGILVLLFLLVFEYCLFETGFPSLNPFVKLRFGYQILQAKPIGRDSNTDNNVSDQLYLVFVNTSTLNKGINNTCKVIHFVGKPYDSIRIGIAR